MRKLEQATVSPPTLRRIASALLFGAGVVSFVSFFVTWYTAEVGKNRLFMSPIRRIGVDPFNAGALVWRLAVMVSALTGVAAGFLALGICAGPLDPNVMLYSIKACLASAGLAILMVLMTSGVIDSGTFEVGFFLCVGVVCLASVALSLLCFDTWDLETTAISRKPGSGYMPVPQDPVANWGPREPYVNPRAAQWYEASPQDARRGTRTSDYWSTCQEDLRPPSPFDVRPPSPPRPPPLDMRQLHPVRGSTPPFTGFQEQPGIQFIQGPPSNALSTPRLPPLAPVVLRQPPMLPTLYYSDCEFEGELAMHELAWRQHRQF